ncbi:hypothetical protein HHI36_015296 [Cryptolaemus montrouzieri]|uniref:Uncharacterized protein n=1 Tax=Cryptolaemus montrouzieri TaxID=559131 RepID=A0ABD2N555_9CUCU
MENVIFDAISDLRQWFDENKLKMNTEKMQLIEFGYSTDFLITTYTRESEVYKTSRGVCFLGVHVDYRLTCRDHIDKVLYGKVLMKVFQRSFPTKRIKITDNNGSSNITFEASEDLLQLKSHLNALGTVARATKHEAVYDLFNAKKQEYHKKMDEEVRQNNIEYIQNGRNFQRAMWNVINNETKKDKKA